MNGKKTPQRPGSNRSLVCQTTIRAEIASRYPQDNIVMVVDGVGWHKAQFKLPENLKLHFLPPYSPERNPQEHIWDELREKWFHNTVLIAWLPWSISL